MEETLEFALVKEACPCCGFQSDGPILMNKKRTKGEAKKIKDLHGKCIGWAKEPCEECKNFMQQGILFVGIVEAKSTKNNPFFSGNKWVIKQEAVEKMVSDPLLSTILSKRMTFIDINLAKELNFPIK